MVVIRLKRGGSRKRPFYFIVAMDKRSRRDGGHLEVLGFYNPTPAGSQQKIEIKNADAIKNWLKNGAEVSETVARLLKEAKFAA